MVACMYSYMLEIEIWPSADMNKLAPRSGTNSDTAGDTRLATLDLFAGSYFLVLLCGTDRGSTGMTCWLRPSVLENCTIVLNLAGYLNSTRPEIAPFGSVHLWKRRSFIVFFRSIHCQMGLFWAFCLGMVPWWHEQIGPQIGAKFGYSWGHSTGDTRFVCWIVLSKSTIRTF